MADYLAADTEGMRTKVPALSEAAALAHRLGTGLQAKITANEPIADWETDEVTADYMKAHKYLKEFTTEFFQLLSSAVGGDVESTLVLTSLLEEVEEHNLAEAKKVGSPGKST